jgi:hypothetical protein
MACGAEMILMHVVPDETMAVAGFEHHTFMCSECYDVERRLAFTKPSESVDPIPLERPPIHLPSAPPSPRLRSSQDCPLPRPGFSGGCWGGCAADSCLA